STATMPAMVDPASSSWLTKATSETTVEQPKGPGAKPSKPGSPRGGASGRDARTADKTARRDAPAAGEPPRFPTAKLSIADPAKASSSPTTRVGESAPVGGGQKPAAEQPPPFAAALDISDGARKAREAGPAGATAKDEALGSKDDDS